jgi:serine/threonine-protein phosphatase 4 catalytic subunit
MTTGSGDRRHWAMMEALRNCVLPAREEVIRLVDELRETFMSEPNVLELSSPINIVGDVHGHFFDLLNMFSLMEDPSAKRYLFLGDYVDRGHNSVEVVLLLLLYKRAHGSNMFMIRGNHETRMLSAIYGFREECRRKYDLVVYWRICDLFQLLPVAAVVDGEYFCVHGGLVPGLTVDHIMKNDRVGELTPLIDILWSDPSETPGFEKNPRGAGYLFGEDVLDLFLQSNSFRCVIRSHQLVLDGYKSHFDGKLYTVWGAPNYCYSAGNLACVMVVDEGGHGFRLFDKCNEQFRDEGTGCDLFED